jgi:molecular chaperone DnaK (HSP70)
VSYVDSSKASIDDIHIIKQWPGQGDEVWKTPSRVAFGPENKLGNDINLWGYQVTPKHISYSWFKLLLDASATLTEFDDLTLSDLGRTQGTGIVRIPKDKTAGGVCTAYLKELHDELFRHLIQRLSPEIVQVTPLEFWFTVPALWSDKAKNSTREAAKAAGFGSREGDIIHLIPEPEAAAVATLRVFADEGRDDKIKPGDGVLICDCGGGTVDVTSYAILATQPKLEFEELVVGAGGKCASTYIDRQFHLWMSSRFGADFDNLPFEKKGPGSRFMKEFEDHKRNFGTARAEEEYELTLFMPQRHNSHNYDSDEGMVKFTR